MERVSQNLVNSRYSNYHINNSIKNAQNKWYRIPITLPSEEGIISLYYLEGHLTLEQQRIESGIWIDAKLSFHKQVEYLRKRMSAGLALMRHITSLSGGADYHVLRTFYVHAKRPIIEYSAPTLANLTETQICSLVGAQNNTLRLILGASMWTRICNVQMECNIPHCTQE